MEISKHETLWLKSEGAKMLMDLGVKEDDHVIDYGCGEGRYTIPLSQLVGKHGFVYALEKDEDAKAVAQERLPLFSNPEVVSFLKVEDIKSLDPIGDGTINAVVAFDVLQYVRDWDALFRYFSNLLKPRGIVCIYPAAVPHPGDVDIELAISKMEKSGFQYLKSTKYRMMHNVDMVDDLVYSFCLK